MKYLIFISIVIITVSITTAGCTGSLPTIAQLSERALGAQTIRACTVCGSPSKPCARYCPAAANSSFESPTTAPAPTPSKSRITPFSDASTINFPPPAE